MTHWVHGLLTGAAHYNHIYTQIGALIVANYLLNALFLPGNSLLNVTEGDGAKNRLVLLFHMNHIYCFISCMTWAKTRLIIQPLITCVVKHFKYHFQVGRLKCFAGGCLNCFDGEELQKYQLQQKNTEIKVYLIRILIVMNHETESIDGTTTLFRDSYSWLNNVNNWERTKQKYIISFTKWPAARSNRKVTNIIN